MGVRVTVVQGDITEQEVDAVVNAANTRMRGGGDRLLAFKNPHWQPLDSTVVNGYIGETTGMEATAKDFRTWHATVIAAAALAEAEESATSQAKKKRAISATMKEVAEFLGNTPTLARTSYVDPRVVDAFEQGRTISVATRKHYDKVDQRQAALERAVLKLLS